MSLYVLMLVVIRDAMFVARSVGQTERRNWNKVSLSGKVISCSCSHIGGHKYAGNLMVYGTDPFGKVTGHWYGYTSDDVRILMDSHIGKGEMIEKLWRGQMGVYEGGKGDKKKHGEQPKVVQKEAQSGCCQGANGVSCCRDERSEVKRKTGPTNKRFDCLSDWIGSFEQENVLAAAEVKRLAYSLYRRSA